MDRNFAFINEVNAIPCISFFKKRRVFFNLLLYADRGNFYQVYFFAIIDNCNRTRLVATALLEDETEESFVWALSMIKKCTNDLISKVIFIDSDLAIVNVIKLRVFRFYSLLIFILYGWSWS